MFRVTQFCVCVCQSWTQIPASPWSPCVAHPHASGSEDVVGMERWPRSQSRSCVCIRSQTQAFFLALDASVTDVSFKELFPTVGPSRVQSHVVTLP